MASSPAGDLLQHLDWVRDLAARLVFDPGQRDDLAQEIWHAALRRPPADGVPLRAWLTGIGRNLAARLHRTDVRRTRRDQAVVRTGEAASPASLAEHAELQQRLLAAVNALPAELRDVVLLRHLEGLPPRAIARQLAIPVATVRTRLQRAHERLRARLDEDFGDRRAWAIAFAVLPRPRHVAAAAGAGTTLLHLTLFTMKANKLLTAAAALLVLAAVPTTLVLSKSRLPTPPDYGQTTPIASVLDRPPSPATPAQPALRVLATPANPAVFHGRVVDGKGNPIGGALLRVWPQWKAESLRDEGASCSHLETTSATDGSFTMTPWRSEKWGIHVQAEHADHVPVFDGVVCRPGEATTIVMLRTHTVPLTVEVHDRKTGTPAPRFRVVGTTQLRAPGQPADVPGLQQLKAPDGGLGIAGVFRGTARFVEGLPFDVFAQCPGHGRSGWNDGSDPVPRATVQPQPGKAVHLRFAVDFDAAEALARVVQRGRVVDAAGQAVPGTVISWLRDYTRHRRQYYRYVQSRADGTFAIALPDDGTLPTLRVHHDDHETQLVAADPTAELVLRLGPLGSLRCRIVDGDGNPVANAAVLVKADRDERTDDSFQARRRTDERGEVHLVGLHARTYFVNVLRRFGDADDDALTSASYRLQPGQQLEVTLATAAGDAVHVLGTIVGGSDGLAPLFVPHAGEPRWIKSRSNGRRYDAGGVPRGDHLVVLLPVEDGRTDLPTILLPRVTVQGLGTAAIDLFVPTGLVRGRIATDRSDRANLRVVAVPNVPAGGLAAELIADEKLVRRCGTALADDGSFELRHVADGAFRLEVRDGAKVLAARPIDVRGSLDVGDWTLER